MYHCFKYILLQRIKLAIANTFSASNLYSYIVKIQLEIAKSPQGGASPADAEY